MLFWAKNDKFSQRILFSACVYFVLISTNIIRQHILLKQFNNKKGTFKRQITRAVNIYFKP